MSTPALISLGPRASASTYPGRPEHVHQVRADLRRLLRGCPVADDVILCVSRRSGGTFTVRTESWPGADVRIEVEDAGGPWVTSAPDPTHGRGLDIVRTLADDWGITTTPAGRAVWARITWRAQSPSGLAQPDEAA
jgi:hypothetical protein